MKGHRTETDSRSDSEQDSRVRGERESSDGASRRLRSLHGAVGNQAVKRLADERVQARLTVSNPGDAAEREAERVADAVVASTGTTDGERSGPARGQMGGALASRAVSSRSGIDRLDADLEAEIAALRGGGRPLPTGVRTDFEGDLGVDFEDVRIHTGPNADAVARSIGARAFTVGRDVAFRRGEYDPQSRAGTRLLAHELTHVVQQGQAGPEQVQRQGEPGDRIQTLGGESDGEQGTAQALAESTLMNLFDDVVGDVGKAAARKVGSSVPLGKILVATRKVAIGFAEAAGEAMKDAREDLAAWKQKRVQQSDLPKYAAMAKYDHQSQGKALAHIPTILWEGVKGAFETLVMDVFYGELLGELDDSITDRLAAAAKKHAPSVANAANLIAAKTPGPVADVAEKVNDAFIGAAEKMGSVAAATYTGRSVAELVVEVDSSLDNVEDAVGEVIADFRDLRTETTRLVHEWRTADGRNRLLIDGEFNDLDEMFYTAEDADVSQDAQQVAESVEKYLQAFDDQRERFAGGGFFSLEDETAAAAMGKSLERAGKSLARLHEEFGWPVWGMIERVVDLLRSLEDGALSGYSLDVDTDLFP